MQGTQETRDATIGGAAASFLFHAGLIAFVLLSGSALLPPASVVEKSLEVEILTPQQFDAMVDGGASGTVSPPPAAPK